MPETDKSIAIRVQAHLRAAGKPVPALADIVPLVSSGLEELGSIIAASETRRRELRPANPFTLAIASGSGSLATLLAAPVRLILEALPFAEVRDQATGAKLFFLGRDRYELQQPSPWGYFTFERQTMYARLANEDAGASSFTAEISGNYVPTADEVPLSCVPDLVLLVVRLVGAVSKGVRS